MVPYKPDVINIEDDLLNFSPIGQNKNSYPREYNNFGFDSSMVLLYDGHLSDTIITEKIDLSWNKILESRDSFLSSIHIGLHIDDAKYRI